MNNSTAYIAIDLHKTQSVIGHMDEHGAYISHNTIATSTTQLISHVVAIESIYKY